MSVRWPVLLCYSCALALSLAGACSKPLTEEDQVRAAIAGIEEAARARDVKALKEYISDSYSDSQGNKKNDAGAMAAYYFFQHPKIHVLSRIHSIEFPEPGTRARAELVAALAGTAFASAEELGRLSADIYRFEFEFTREDGDWRVVSASWHPAGPQDLF